MPESGNIMDEKSVEECMKAIKQKFGKLNGVVSCAGKCCGVGLSRFAVSHRVMEVLLLRVQAAKPSARVPDL